LFLKSAFTVLYESLEELRGLKQHPGLTT
jgi:hypothetical protein